MFRYIKGMEKEYLDYVKAHNLIKEDDVVVIGISGGADSVCLLLLLNRFKSYIPFTLLAAHVNHGIRENAKRDCEFVRSLCRKERIELFEKEVSIPEIIKGTGESAEEAGRRVRYEFFREILSEHALGKRGKIAVAHHADDNCETILFHLIRGSALKGLSGMEAECNDVIRPLLWAQKCEIEAYLSFIGQDYVEDETNASTDYSRNRIRHEIIPGLLQICPGAKKNILEAAAVFSETESYLSEETGACFIKHVSLLNETGDCMNQERPVTDKIKEDASHLITPGLLIRDSLLQEHPCMINRVLYEGLSRVAGRKKDISKVQVRELYDLFGKNTGKRRDFIYGIKAVRTYDGVRLYTEETLETGPNRTKEDEEAFVLDLSDGDVRKKLESGQKIKVSFRGENYFLSVSAYDGNKKIPDKTYTKWFDYDKINNCLTFRTPREKDYFVVNSEGNKKELKKFFKDEKVEREFRQSMTVIADGFHILWIVGMRMSKFYQVQGNTERILEIQLGGTDV